MSIKAGFWIIAVLICSYLLEASQRPTVGLVLSGGGARGGAHAGVLQLLEERHIPIDYIVGTSMGSLMGGLYASGYSAKELQQLLVTTPWEKYITTKKPRREIPFRRKTLESEFPGSIKVGIDARDEVALPTGVFEKQSMLFFLRRAFKDALFLQDFTRLPISYAAVATDLSNGESVELIHGNIAKSVYASLCVPGGFEPIEIDGKILVDGGISQNLPLRTMRKLFHPDYIIVVDISTPFDKKRKFNSYDEIMAQQLDILTRKNVEDTIKSMRPNEFLIEPELQGYSFLDADKYPEIIQKGYESAKSNYDKIAFLSLDEQSYMQYKKKHRYKLHAKPPVIDAVEIHNETFLSDKAIRARIHQPLGARLDFERLQQDLMDLYYLMYFSFVDYKIVSKEGENVLVIIAKPAWNVHGDIRAGIEFEDDFNGHSDYQVRFEYNKYNLNAYGGEWRNRVEVGKRRLFKSEIYQPLDYTQTSYFRLNAYVERVKHYVTPNLVVGNETLSNDETLPLVSSNAGGVVGFGINFGSLAQLEAGLHAKRVRPSVDTLVIDGNTTYFVTKKTKQRLSSIYATLRFDGFDNTFFPKSGYKGVVGYRKNMKMLGSDVAFSQVYMQITGAYTFGKSTLVPKIKIGSTLNKEGLHVSDGTYSSVQDISAYYHLGGLFNISGRTTYNKTGDEMYFGSLNYRYSVISNKFLSSITSEAYVGCSLEAGKTWYKQTDSFGFGKILVGSSAYIAIDTILGPFYFAYGYSDKIHQTLYFSLGKSY